MKNFALFLFIIGISLSLKAQNDSLTKDGTTWQYVYTSLLDFSCDYIVTDGDTLVDGKTYKKAYRYSSPVRRANRGNATLECVFREEGNKIYALSKPENQYLPQVNGETLLYDFSLKTGDVVKTSYSKDGYAVTQVGSVLIDGKLRKRIHLDSWDTWIEGIGSIKRYFGSPLSPLADNGEYTKLEMFEQNKNVLYGSRRFNLLADGVHWTERESPKDTHPEMNSTFSLTEYRVNGDTIIDGITYKKIYSDGSPYINLRQDEEGRIYYHGKNKDNLMYNWSWKKKSDQPFKAQSFTGEEVTLFIEDTYYPHPVTLLDGHTYDCSEVDYHSTYYSHEDKRKLYFGIGLSQGFFQHLMTVDTDCICFNDLVSLYNSDNQKVYQSPLFNEKGENTAGISSTSADKNFSVSGQKGQIEVELKNLPETTGATIYIYDTKGCLLYEKPIKQRHLTIDNMAAGLYIYRLETDNAVLENGKLIVK